MDPNNNPSVNSPSATYFISDERMLLHRNEWDASYPEKPLRLKSILDAVRGESLLKRCQVLPSHKASEKELQLVHSKELVEQMKATKDMDEAQLAHFTQHQEHVYVNNHTWEACLLAAGCALRATEMVWNNPGTNAFAAIRPPGHHASHDRVAGFCFFNNVALCAKKAVEEMGVKRVLIVDWDVHFGNGTQLAIADHPDSIRLISIHHFEHGKAYPKLAEGAIGHEYANTVNVPLNQVGYGDAEYAAFIELVVRPMVEEWRPELLLVSCGFDAAIGDMLGGMLVSPLGYGYMAGALAATGIPMAVLLEGGYFIDSVLNGAVFALRAMIEKAPPHIPTEWPSPQPSFLHTLYAAMIHYSESCTLYAEWLEVVNAIRRQHELGPKQSVADGEYHEQSTKEIYPMPLVGLFPGQPPAVIEKYCDEIEAIVKEWKTAQEKPSMPKRICTIEHNGSKGGPIFVTIDKHTVAVALKRDADREQFLQLVKMPLRCLHGYEINVKQVANGQSQSSQSGESAKCCHSPVEATVEVLKELIFFIRALRDLVLF